MPVAASHTSKLLVIQEIPGRRLSQPFGLRPAGHPEDMDVGPTKEEPCTLELSWYSIPSGRPCTAKCRPPGANWATTGRWSGVRADRTGSGATHGRGWTS